MPRRSQLFLEPPRWVRVRHSGHRPVPPRAASWLFETGSLTRRLRHLCGLRFNVRLLWQDWDKPYANESRALRLSAGRRAIIREVALQAGDTPLVVARSVIPAQTLRGVDRRLAHLGTRPLGEILFADRRLRRSHLALADIGPAGWRPEWRRRSGAGKVHGRRSLFTLGCGHTLLVAEFFLPDLFNLER